jgi:hypothetical protein
MSLKNLLWSQTLAVCWVGASIVIAPEANAQEAGGGFGGAPADAGGGGVDAGGASEGGGAQGGTGEGGSAEGGAGGAAAGYDEDGDGFSAELGDCNDYEPGVHPGAPETCNQVDDDCDGTVDENDDTTRYADADRDGYGAPDAFGSVCDASFLVLQPGDCDDNDYYVNPGVTRDYRNGFDDDCDGEIDEDDTGYDSGFGDIPNAVSGTLLAAWLGLGTWRRKRQRRS